MKTNPQRHLGPVPRERWVSKERLLEFSRTLPEDPTFFEDIEGLAEASGPIADPWECALLRQPQG